jgi:hypothetical protein
MTTKQQKTEIKDVLIKGFATRAIPVKLNRDDIKIFESKSGVMGVRINEDISPQTNIAVRYHLKKAGYNRVDKFFAEQWMDNYNAVIHYK